MFYILAMDNILQDTQYTTQEKASILCKAYYKQEYDLVLYYHYTVTFEDITGNKSHKEVI